MTKRPIAEQEKHLALRKYVVVFLSTPVVSCVLYNTTAEQGSHTPKGTSSMSIEDTNKAIFLRSRPVEDPPLTLEEVSVRYDEILSPDFVDHNPGPGCPGGAHCDYYKQAQKEAMVGFSDGHFTINHLIAEGDLVVLHVTNTWTHTGMFFGKPPTGKQITATSITIYRLADGKIVESWDDHRLNTDLEQLLAMP